MGESRTIINILDEGIEIACGIGSAIIDQLQRPGKKPLKFSELMRGLKLLEERFAHSRFVLIT